MNLLDISHYLLYVTLALQNSAQQERHVDTNYPTLSYEGKTYYIYNDYFMDFQTAVDNCRADGGMLVEINTEGEYRQIQQYLSSVRTFNNLFLGGFYQPQTGEWVLASNNHTLPYEDWYHEREPKNNGRHNCMILYEFFNWRMYSVGCSFSSVGASYRRYMCEI